MCMYCGPIPWLYLWAGSFIFVCCFVHKFLAMTQSDTFVNRCTFVCKHCCSLFFIYAFLCWCFYPFARKRGKQRIYVCVRFYFIFIYIFSFQFAFGCFYFFFFFLLLLLLPFYHSTQKWLPLAILIRVLFGVVAAVVAVIVVTMLKKILVIFLGLDSIFILRIKRSFIVVVSIVCASFSSLLFFILLNFFFFFGETNTSPSNVYMCWACKLLRSIGNVYFRYVIVAISFEWRI